MPSRGPGTAAQRGSGCSFMIAPRIIEASKGNSEPAWLETSSALPCDGHVADAVGLDPPPDVVEELEERIDRLGELLVEAPLVLVVVAAQPLRQTLDRVAKRPRQLTAARSAAFRDRGRPRSRAACGEGSRRGPRRWAAAALRSGPPRSSPAPSEPAGAIRPGEARARRGGRGSWPRSRGRRRTASNWARSRSRSRSRRLSTPRPNRSSRTPSP